MKKTIILLMAITLSVTLFSQTDKPAKADSTKMEKYVCPMHSDVVSNQPGKCQKCGMDLSKAKTYSCPMHSDIVSNKKDKCTKCGMDLTEVKSKPSNKKG